MQDGQNMCGWFSEEDAQRDGRFVVWETPAGGQVEITAAFYCDRMGDPARQPRGEFRGPVTKWLRTERIPVRRDAGATAPLSALGVLPRIWPQRSRPGREPFVAPDVFASSLGSTIERDAEAAALFDATARADREAFRRQHADQIIASLSAPLDTLGRAGTIAEGAQDSGSAGLRRSAYDIDQLGSRRALATAEGAQDSGFPGLRRVPYDADRMVRRHPFSRRHLFNASYKAGPGQWRTPMIDMEVPTRAMMYGENVDPDYQLAARAVYGLVRATAAIEAARRMGGSVRGGLESPTEQAAVARRRVLLALQDLLEAQGRPGADVAQARTVFDDALAVAAHVTNAIEETLAANGFTFDVIQ